MAPMKVRFWPRSPVQDSARKQPFRGPVRARRVGYAAANRRAPTRAGSVVARTASNAAWASG
jgi:hypothetical protein